MKQMHPRYYLKMKATSIDILNDPEYSQSEEVRQFRDRCKCKYPATELAFIQRGINGDINMLEYCNVENVLWYYNLVEKRMKEWEEEHRKNEGGCSIMECKYCGFKLYPIDHSDFDHHLVGCLKKRIEELEATSLEWHRYADAKPDFGWFMCTFKKGKVTGSHGFAMRRTEGVMIMSIFGISFDESLIEWWACLPFPPRGEGD